MPMIRYRAALVGIALSILIATLVVAVELLTAGQYIASQLPAPGPIAVLFVAMLLAAPLPRLLIRRIGLNESDLRIVYAMMLVAGPVGAACGLGAMPYALMGPYQNATEENQWPQHLWPLVPSLFRTGQPAAEAFFMGESEAGVPWSIWFGPLVAYGCFFAALYTLYFCTAALLRREWEEHERLPFPLAQIPLWLARGAGQRRLPDICYRPAFWICLALPLVCGSLRALHAMVPQVPELRTDVSLGALFREPPWDILAMYGIRISLSFAIVGVAFLVPSEVSFSVWFLFWVGCLVYVSGKALGIASGEFSSGLGRFPMFSLQRDGAFLALAGTTLWLARRHLRTVLLSVWPGRPQVDDRSEPLPYRWAVGGCVAAVAALMVWKIWAGAGAIAAFCSVIFLLAVAISLARIRAEVGLPAPGDIPVFSQTVTQVFGSSALSGSTRVSEACTWFTQGIFNASQAHPLPSMIEGYRVAGSDQPGARFALTGLLVWSVAVSAVTSVTLGLAMMYHFGAGELDWIRQQAAHAPWSALVSDLRTPAAPDGWGTLFLSLGAALFVMIWLLRTRFAAWPFHPIGFLIALDTWTVSSLWFSVLLGWLLRRVIQRYGGRKGYRLLLPGAIGLIAGDMCARVFWSTLAALIGKGYVPV